MLRIKLPNPQPVKNIKANARRRRTGPIFGRSRPSHWICTPQAVRSFLSRSSSLPLFSACKMHRCTWNRNTERGQNRRRTTYSPRGIAAPSSSPSLAPIRSPSPRGRKSWYVWSLQHPTARFQLASLPLQAPLGGPPSPLHLPRVARHRHCSSPVSSLSPLQLSCTPCLQ